MLLGSHYGCQTPALLLQFIVLLPGEGLVVGISFKELPDGYDPALRVNTYLQQEISTGRYTVVPDNGHGIAHQRMLRQLPNCTST